MSYVDDEEDFTHILKSGSETLHLCQGENWLRLVLTNGGVNLLADTQEADQDLPQPSIISLKEVVSVEWPTDDCFICIDIDGPFMTIKDARPPEDLSQESEDFVVCLQKKVDDDSYGTIVELSRRQLRHVFPGDRICTVAAPRLSGSQTSGSKAQVGELGLILTYHRKDKGITQSQSQFSVDTQLATQLSAKSESQVRLDTEHENDSDNNDDEDDDALEDEEYDPDQDQTQRYPVAIQSPERNEQRSTPLRTLPEQLEEEDNAQWQSDAIRLQQEEKTEGIDHEENEVEIRDGKRPDADSFDDAIKRNEMSAPKEPDGDHSTCVEQIGSFPEDEDEQSVNSDNQQEERHVENHTCESTNQLPQPASAANDVNDDDDETVFEDPGQQVPEGTRDNTSVLDELAQLHDDSLNTSKMLDEPTQPLSGNSLEKEPMSCHQRIVDTLPNEPQQANPGEKDTKETGDDLSEELTDVDVASVLKLRSDYEGGLPAEAKKDDDEAIDDPEQVGASPFSPFSRISRARRSPLLQQAIDGAAIEEGAKSLDIPRSDENPPSENKENKTTVSGGKMGLHVAMNDLNPERSTPACNKDKQASEAVESSTPSTRQSWRKQKDEAEENIALSVRRSSRKRKDAPGTSESETVAQKRKSSPRLKKEEFDTSAVAKSHERHDDSQTSIASRKRKRNDSQELRVLVTGFALSSKHSSVSADSIFVCELIFGVRYLLSRVRQQQIKAIGGVLLQETVDASSATHVIASNGQESLRRTPKLMIALCKTSNIVTLKWLEDSAKKRTPLSTRNYLVLNDKVSERKYNFRMQNTLQNGENLRQEGKTLLGGRRVYICNGVAGNKAPPDDEMKLIIHAAGGKCVSSAAFLHNGGIIITSEEGQEEQLLDGNVTKAITKGAKPYTTSWLFNCILRQELNED
jgi:hypothetical protein